MDWLFSSSCRQLNLKIYENLLSLETRKEFCCSSWDKEGPGWDKIGFELFVADFISLLVEGMLPRAEQVINIIKVYLPMKSITSDGFPIEEQKWNASVSVRKWWESQRSLMWSCQMHFRSPVGFSYTLGSKLNYKGLLIIYYHFILFASSASFCTK